jgi:predicted RNase H-like HicB family nuclease
LSLNYPFRAHVADDGEYVVTLPDLPGCYTGAPTLEELPAMILEAKQLWMETQYEFDREIRTPTTSDAIDDDYSGKFNLRLPKSLHRALAEAAERDGVSLNQHVLALLARRDAEERAARHRPTAPKHRVAEDRTPYQAGPPRRRSSSTKPTTSASRKPRRKTTR